MTILEILKKEGIEVWLKDNGKIGARSGADFNQAQLDFLQEYKQQIIEELISTTPVSWWVLMASVKSALMDRGESETNIREVLDDIKSDYMPKDWPELKSYFDQMLRLHAPRI